MMSFLKSFFDDQSGATAVEYGLLCALIAVVVLTAVSGAATALKNTYEAVANAQPVPTP